MTYNNSNMPILARINDDFSMQVDAGFDITGMTPKFAIQAPSGDIDLSAYCVNASSTSFIIFIKASIVASTIGVLKAPYDVVIDQGDGSKEFLFGGQITVADGVA